MISQELKDIADKIGRFFLQEYCGDKDKTREFLQQLQIQDIAIEDGKIAITTSRPGLFIGRRGRNIERLVGFLGRNIIVKEAKECWYDCLTQFDYDDWEHEQYMKDVSAMDRKLEQIMDNEREREEEEFDRQRQEHEDEGGSRGWRYL